jgi:hypothetical protein
VHRNQLAAGSNRRSPRVFNRRSNKASELLRSKVATDNPDKDNRDPDSRVTDSRVSPADKASDNSRDSPAAMVSPDNPDTDNRDTDNPDRQARTRTVNLRVAHRASDNKAAVIHTANRPARTRTVSPDNPDTDNPDTDSPDTDSPVASVRPDSPADSPAVSVRPDSPAAHRHTDNRRARIHTVNPAALAHPDSPVVHRHTDNRLARIRTDNRPADSRDTDSPDNPDNRVTDSPDSRGSDSNLVIRRPRIHMQRRKVICPARSMTSRASYRHLHQARSSASRSHDFAIRMFSERSCSSLASRSSPRSSSR